MPRAIVTVHSDVEEGNDVFLTNRIVMADNTQLVQSDVNGNITVNVYPISGAGEGRVQTTSIFTKADISKTAVIFDTYQTTYWDGKDATGYNFLYQLQYDATGAAGPYLRGGHSYAVEFSCRADLATDFGTMRWKHILHVRPGLTV